jgi:hypothetical protein
MRALRLAALLAAMAAVAGCGDDCIGVARIGEDGLVAAGACGDLPTATPTTPVRTPTPA